MALVRADRLAGLLALCANLTFPDPGGAQETFAPQFRVDRWTTAQGLPGMSVTTLIQGPDGYLWLVASGTLVRFDGFQFTPLVAAEPGVQGARPRGVLPLSGDTLLVIGTSRATSSSLFSRFVRGRLVDTRELRGAMIEVHRDRTGDLWLREYQRGMTRLQRDAAPLHLPIALEVIGSGELGPQVTRDRFGNLWVVDTERDSIGQLLPDGVRFRAASPFPLILTRPSTGDVLTASRRGDVVTVMSPEGDQLASVAIRGGALPRLVDRHGRLWVSTASGLEVFGSGSQQPLARVVLPDLDRVVEVIEDREGNLWVRSLTEGLYRVREQPVVTVGMDDGMVGKQAMTIARGLAGTMLITDQRGGLYRHSRGALTRVVDPRRPWITLPSWPTPVEEGSDGTVWIPTTTAVVGVRPGRANLVLPVPVSPSLIQEDPRRDGTLWVIAGDLYRFRPATGGRDSIPVFGAEIRSVAFDPAGKLWVPTDSGLLRVDEGNVTRFVDSMWVGRYARSVHVDSTGTLWIGTYGRGLLRFRNGVFRRATAADGLAENIASSVQQDDAGNLWMAGNRSVHRASLSQLNAFMDGTLARIDGVAYDRFDGIPNPEGSGWPGARDATGRLWFPTFDGVAIVDPHRASALDVFAPLVHIGRVSTPTGVLPRDTATGQRVRVPAGARRLDISFTAISLRNPDGVTFRYRLDGFDPQWIASGASRNATYTGVGGGEYVFRVQARSAGGVWSETDAVLTLNVAPLFYETFWFFGIVALGLAGTGYGVARARVRLALRRQRELNLLVGERTALLSQQTAETARALATVEQQAERLRALDSARSRMFANVSHEFRTPLTLIVGPLRDLRAGRLGALPESARQEIEVVLESSERLNTLVEELLDVARLEVGELKLRLQTADMMGFLRRVARGFESMARARHIQYTVVLPAHEVRVDFDRERLQKVITNLLGNAFKFTADGGRVSLTASLPDDEPDTLVIDVDDTGIGIPAHALERVFDRFYQVDDSSRRQHQGAGVGLALAKELVELHGGRVSVTSVEGEGSAFRVRLPLRSADADNLVFTADRRTSAEHATPQAAAAEADHATHEGPVVLVVEDNQGVRAYLRRHLERAYQVLEAADGVEGLEKARRYTPDVVVSDVMMPRMDGHELVDAIREDPELNWLPVVLLTARASHESRMAGLRHGADEYLTKPVDVEELLLRVHNLIESRQRLRQRLGAANRALPVFDRPATRQDRETARFVADLERLVLTHLEDENFGVDELAFALNMSRSSLYRRTQEVLDRSPMDVLWEARLDLAAKWLRETEANINEIAYGVGFKSVPHFSRKFRDRFGVTPTGFRRD